MRPSRLPRRVDPVEEIVVSQAYVERPVVAALEPSRFPDAGDVNALGEVCSPWTCRRRRPTWWCG
jgi:hypothetical protein